MTLRSLLILGLALAACRSPEPRFETPRATDEGHATRGEAAAERPAPAPTPEPPPPAPAPADLPEVAEPTDPAPAPDPRLRTPAELNERAPETFTVWVDTTKGPIVIDVTRAWSPEGADRFYNLVKAGYYTDVAFFRVIEGFMAQIGIHGDPAMNTVWQNANIQDDPVVESNTRGMVSYAKTGLPNSRSTQFFINYADNSRLDGMGFSPFGRVRDMRTVEQLFSGYGEGAPSGRGPDQGRIQREGNTYLRSDFPNLDYIRSARIVAEGARGQ
ncbi:MAG: peptidylprolyl isomerase [Myxococcales bacterium]|nr:peptidylprolyl isomerase [Myxococcales bacterium]